MINTKSAEAKKDRRNDTSGVLPENWLSKARELRLKSHARTCSIVSVVLFKVLIKWLIIRGMQALKRF